MKRLLSAVLAVIMLFSGALTVFADETEVNGTLSFSKENTLYESENEAASGILDFEASTEPANANGNYITDKNAVAAGLRQAMVERRASYSVKYKASTAINNPWFDDLVERVMTETSNPKEGDYLRNHYKSIHLGGTYSYERGYYYNDIVFNLEYMSTAAQESTVDKMVPQVLEKIHLRKWMTDYDKIKAIYEYVCKNVEYDYDSSDSYDLKYTAYAAFANGTAVCSGYASMFYRLARAAGYEVRIVTGSTQNEAHAWNLIKLGGKYYYLDPTWDSGYLYYTYFLKGTAEFKDHTPDSPFISNYKISKNGYDVNLENSATRGTCGPMARWAVVDNTTLIIYGSGMVNTDGGFSAYKNTIKDIYLFDTVTGITMDVSFNGFTALRSLSVARKDFHWGISSKSAIPAGVTLIGHSGTNMHTFAKNNKYPFEQYVANPFYDVEEVDYYYKPVLEAVEKGITTGVNSSHFAPNQSCNRGQAVTFIWRAYGEPGVSASKNPFTDVRSNDYYYKPVLWAVKEGITTGADSSHFKPEDTLTRAQFVTFLWRSAGKPQVYNKSNPFTDVKETDYYYDAVLWAVESGITTGVQKDKFGPNDTCTRGQVVTFLSRAFS